MPLSRLGQPARKSRHHLVNPFVGFIGMMAEYSGQFVYEPAIVYWSEANKSLSASLIVGWV